MRPKGVTKMCEKERKPVYSEEELAKREEWAEEDEKVQHIPDRSELPTLSNGEWRW